MKTTIIKILNQLANGEEPPKKIIWKDKIYNYNEYEKDYYDTDELDAIFDYHEITDILNEEVQVLETTITYAPKLGSVICWKKSKNFNKKDGAGYVGVVSKVNSDGSVETLKLSSKISKEESNK